MNALMLASQRGHHKMVLLLMLAGAHIDEQTAQGSTALMLACKRGNELCVKQLIGLGAEIFVLDGKERTALDTATKKATQSHDVAVKKQFAGLIPWLSTSVQTHRMSMIVRSRRNKLLFKVVRDMQSNNNELSRPLIHEYMDIVLTYVRRVRAANPDPINGYGADGVIHPAVSELAPALERLFELLPLNDPRATTQLHAGLVFNVKRSFLRGDLLRRRVLANENMCLPRLQNSSSSNHSASNSISGVPVRHNNNVSPDFTFPQPPACGDLRDGVSNAARTTTASSAALTPPPAPPILSEIKERVTHPTLSC